MFKLYPWNSSGMEAEEEEEEGEEEEGEVRIKATLRVGV